MFIAALFTVANIWKQSKCPSTDEWIKKMWYTHTHTHTHTHNRILLSHKKEWNFAICSNMDGLGGHYAKWNKSDRERHAAWYHLHVESKKYNKLVNKTKKKQTHRYWEPTSCYRGEREGGRGNVGVGESEAQAIRCKISYKDILYNTGNTANIL